ncbi:MAG TPA: hypothetical protein VLQ66_13965 [Paenisporosarcina sp.]|nr:hypothetical protein [Paenisporosarcina sp.]
MRLLKAVFILIFVTLLVACSNTEEPIVETTPSESKAAFACEDNIYTIERGEVLIENVGEEIGEIESITDKITENGEAVIFDSTIKLEAGTKIYKIRETDRSNPVVAVKIDNTYYGAIFTSNLK